MRPLPKEVRCLFDARNKLCSSLPSDQRKRLSFSFDGKLVGDLGEWIAVLDYGMKLERAGKAGVDGKINNKTVQVKTTITGNQAAFRYLHSSKLAERLMVFKICGRGLGYEVLYDGPQARVVERIYARWEERPETKTRQRSVTAKQLLMHQEENLKAS